MENTIDNTSKKKKKSVSYAKWGYIFLIPFFVAYLALTLYPQILTFGYSFFDYYYGWDDSINMMRWFGPKFVGFKNYVEIFKPVDGQIMIIKYFGNTLLLWVIGAVPQFVVALILAVIFTSTRLNIKFAGFFKSVFYLPNLIMASAFSLLFFALFGVSGPVNDILASMGIERFDFLAQKISVRGLIAFINYLMWFGNTTLLLMAGIQGIDESLFESARIDGATSWRVFKDITMPLLKPIFIYVLITAMIGGVQMFDVPQILTNGKGTPDFSSMTVVMYLNKTLNTGNNYGVAGAISVVLFIITALLSIIVFNTMTKDKD